MRIYARGERAVGPDWGNDNDVDEHVDEHLDGHHAELAPRSARQTARIQCARGVATADDGAV